MIAYFALLSFVPLLFLALSIVGLLGEPTETSYLVRQLRQTFPESSVNSLLDTVRAVQRGAGALSAIGFVGLVWSSLGFFSALESAFNVVYGVPNRRFARGKGLALALAAAAVTLLFVALVVSSVGIELADRAGAGRWLAYLIGIAVSLALIQGLVWSAYRLIPNVELTWRGALPGAIFATVALEASFQGVPLFVRATSALVALQAFGGALVLLVWLYLMANALVLGVEINALSRSR
jgi:membrane protein